MTDFSPTVKLKEIRAFVHQFCELQLNSASSTLQNSTTDFSSTESSSETMAQPNQNQNRARQMTMMEYAAPRAVNQPLCIEIASAYELKPAMIQLLPTFYGKAGECPLKHLRQLKVVCSTAPSDNNVITQQQILLKAFPFSLQGKALDWLYSLPSNSVATWEEMEQIFLEQFFPPSRTYEIQTKIANVTQGDDETLYEYWTRFNQLIDNCPHHRIEEQMLMKHFLDGLTY